MSSMQQPGDRQETDAQRKKGLETFLSPEERRDLQRMLSHPEDLPKDFKSWLEEYYAVNIPQIPLSQIVGFHVYKEAVESAQVVVNQGTVNTAQSTTSTSYTDLTTVGPTLTGLVAGFYVVMFGCSARNTSGGSNGAVMSISVNGAAASNDDKIGRFGEATTVSISRSVAKELTSATNTIEAKYRAGVGGTAEFEHRWVLAMKIANPAT